MTTAPSYLLPPLPEPLGGLADIALNLRWSWNHASDALWRQMSPELWENTHNPWLILQNVSEETLRQLAEDPHSDVLQGIDFAATCQRDHVALGFNTHAGSPLNLHVPRSLFDALSARLGNAYKAGCWVDSSG